MNGEACPVLISNDAHPSSWQLYQKPRVFLQAAPHRPTVEKAFRPHQETDVFDRTLTVTVVVRRYP